MTLLINILIGCIIFGYAGFTLYKSIKKQKKGKCAACSLQKSCSSNVCAPPSKLKDISHK
ncbi:FeoB-associated Cys-rich membrane protein [Lysinibacillus xylanilyticus]|uniref:FeoB-associated Cys-rich membrane protein n=1 Tax=Lysinibacillus xylanilyticus TaxID=582475 RepID=A0A2M9PXA8_9BACI|nr:FeoB-associated Cys-rich membrane protein [Lysinibacillus xylanilyticus]PJO40461.1 FeoB-associated Cys-rich membrane protein [Lysinibacillus xylanilyticus]